MVIEKDSVKTQYEELPYPVRDPEEEKSRLLETRIGNLSLVNILMWKGEKALGKDFRVLDAGCGTGDSAIFMAEQLKDSDAEVVALDFSKTSLDIARKRAEVRGLDNIRFIEMSILDIPNNDLGKFDYITCSGVLHHLENPDEGMRILADLLKEDGGMGVMLYSLYGRLPVYIMQDLLKQINAGADTKTKLDNTRAVLEKIWPIHWFSLAKDAFKDIERFGDAGVYDLLLHSQDRAYTVPQIYELVEGSGLKLVDFAYPVLYRPSFYLKGVANNITERVGQMSKREREGLAELLNSRIKKHTFFASKSEITLPSPDDKDAVPAYIKEATKESARKANEGQTLKVSLGEFSAAATLNEVRASFLRNIDGTKSVGDIIESVAAETNNKEELVRDEWLSFFDEVGGSFFILK